MITVTPYEQWLESAKDAIEAERETNPQAGMTECELCDGIGELHGNSHSYDCPACDGDGWLEDDEKLSRAAYFKHMVADLMAYCAFTRRDFLATVGPFVRAHRIPGWNNCEHGDIAA